MHDGYSASLIRRRGRSTTRAVRTAFYSASTSATAHRAAKKSYRLQIYLHRANQPLIDRVVVAIKTFLPERSVAVIRHGAANRSEDILGAETISIARRAEVKRLDRLFGFGDKLEN